MIGLGKRSVPSNYLIILVCTSTVLEYLPDCPSRLSIILCRGARMPFGHDTVQAVSLGQGLEPAGSRY